MFSISAMGFSWPSTVRVSSAEYTSENASGVGLLPSALKVSRNTLFCITRIFTPCRSSHLFTACLELVTLRKPFSQ